MARAHANKDNKPPESEAPASSNLLPTISNLLHTIETPRPGSQATNQAANLERWMRVIRNGNLSIDVAEQVDNHLARIEYGSIKLEVEHHKVRGIKDARHTKITYKRE